MICRKQHRLSTDIQQGGLSHLEFTVALSLLNYLTCIAVRLSSTFGGNRRMSLYIRQQILIPSAKIRVQFVPKCFGLSTALQTDVHIACPAAFTVGHLQLAE
jgi:hypothetical protein